MCVYASLASCEIDIKSLTNSFKVGVVFYSSRQRALGLFLKRLNYSTLYKKILESGSWKPFLHERKC